MNEIIENEPIDLCILNPRRTDWQPFQDVTPVTIQVHHILSFSNADSCWLDVWAVSRQDIWEEECELPSPLVIWSPCCVSVTSRRRKQQAVSHTCVCHGRQEGVCKIRKCEGRAEGRWAPLIKENESNDCMWGRCLDWCWYTCKSCLSTRRQHCQWFIASGFLFVCEGFYYSYASSGRKNCFADCVIYSPLKHHIPATLFVSTQVCYPCL